VPCVLVLLAGVRSLADRGADRNRVRSSRRFGGKGEKGGQDDKGVDITVGNNTNYRQGMEPWRGSVTRTEAWTVQRFGPPAGPDMPTPADGEPWSSAAPTIGRGYPSQIGTVL
jgi:hypothetical protein